MPSLCEIKDVLLHVREIMADPLRWCPAALAVTADWHCTDPSSEDAVRFCALGAARRAARVPKGENLSFFDDASDDRPFARLYITVVRFLNVVIAHRYARGDILPLHGRIPKMWEVNDHFGREAVLGVLDEAIRDIEEQCPDAREYAMPAHEAVPAVLALA